MRGSSIRPLLTAALILGLMAVALLFPNQRYNLVTLAQQYNVVNNVVSAPGLENSFFGRIVEPGSSFSATEPSGRAINGTATATTLTVVSPELGETVVIPVSAIRRNPRLLISEGAQFGRNPAERQVLQVRSEDLNILVFYLYTRDGSDVFQFNFYDRLGNLIDDRLMLVVPASGPTTWVYESNRPSR